MIVHSTRNELDGTCVVRVEWNPHTDGQPTDDAVRAFATGAAGKHNAGHYVAAPLIQGYTIDGQRIDDGSDTSDANGALVSVAVTP